VGFMALRVMLNLSIIVYVVKKKETLNVRGSGLPSWGKDIIS